MGKGINRKSCIIVQDTFGHKSIMNTEIFTKMVYFRGEEYYSAMAQTLEEVRKLAEDGLAFY
jgi:hypothetical protein